MTLFRYITRILPVLAIAALAGACQDDRLGFSDEELRDGVVNLSLEASFSPFAAGKLSRASNAMDGDGMKDIIDMVILVYDRDGNLLPKFTQKVEATKIKNAQSVDRDPENASNGTLAESSTLSVKNIDLKLPFGQYYIIAVANLGKAVSDTKSTYEVLTTEGGEYAKAAKTLDGLRNIRVGWSVGPDNYSKNSAMLGYFDEEDASSPRAESAFSTVTVNRPGMKLRAWLRRCASKITIDFNGSQLRDNVYVYIKSAKIYDIPKTCTLGFGKGIASTVDETAVSADYNNRATAYSDLENHIYENNWTSTNGRTYPENGQYIEYGEGDDYHNWPCITKGDSVITDKASGMAIDFHKEESPALFFYENMQGDAPYGKIPVPDLNDGGVYENDPKYPHNFKDAVEFGTYIEVEGFYHSDANGNISEGPIKYRFMIGKDVDKNCDAERNYHYKLTLCPRGNGNDYDWHIDFNEESGFIVPNPWYVSYVYNHKSVMPFKYIPPEDYELVEITAEIIQNPWYSCELKDKDGNPASNTDPDAFIKKKVPDNEKNGPYLESTKNDYTGNGFLSLRDTSTKTVITNDDAGGDFKGYLVDTSKVANQRYFEGMLENTVNRSKRTYTIGKSTVEDVSNTEREKYSYDFDREKVSFQIPLFTRAKVMIKQTGYTGNNPYVGQQRIAKLQLTAKIRKIDDHSTIDYVTQNVNVIQVRRVVNPKGVYRSADNFDPFHVTLMWLDGNKSENFTPVESYGPWRAEIIGDDNFITLNGKKTVSGHTGENIDFTIRFNRLGGSGNKNAIVRVLYHNYTCTHLIFVRRGLDPQSLGDVGYEYTGTTGGKPVGGNKKATIWSSFNMIGKDTEATDPRDEGSLFKFGNADEPIDAINNAYYKMVNGEKVEDYHIPADDDFLSQTPEKFVIFGKGPMSWTQIGHNANGFARYADSEIRKCATMRDFEQLYLTDNHEFGYGVLYADGATETQVRYNDAYGWHRDDPDKTNRDKKGMRGMFAYYWDKDETSTSIYNGRSVFFPIGRSSFGHRKEGSKNWSGALTELALQKGILRYACSRGVYADMFELTAPLFASMYIRPGAIYYARKILGKSEGMQWDKTFYEGNAYGLDINYFTLDVNAIYDSNIANGADACFVRCVSE